MLLKHYGVALFMSTNKICKKVIDVSLHKPKIGLSSIMIELICLTADTKSIVNTLHNAGW